MGEQEKRLIAPIVITFVMVVYYLIYFYVIIHMVGAFVSIILGVVPIVAAGVITLLCVKKIREYEGTDDNK